MRSYFCNGLLILDVGLAMNIYSKFGICLICMLALVLLAVTPGVATSDGMIGAMSGPTPANLQHHPQSDIKRSFASGVIPGVVPSSSKS